MSRLPEAALNWTTFDIDRTVGDLRINEESRIYRYGIFDLRVVEVSNNYMSIVPLEDPSLSVDLEIVGGTAMF